MSVEEEISFYEDDVYRSRRLPDMHGGQKDAQASPQTLEEEPGSQVKLRKKHEESIRRVHGENEPKASLPVLVNLLRTNHEILKTLKTIKELMEYQIPLGRTYAFSIPFATGANFTHIDFTDSNNTYGLPSGTFVNNPGHKLAKLKIFNDGPGTIKFSSNMPYSERTTEVQLNAGEFDDSLDFHYTLISTLNIAVTSGAPVVRVFCVV